MYHKNNKGFTLTELLIAIVIGFMLIAAASATYIAQNRSFTSQESVSEVNTQSKISHDIITDAIKRAGFGVPMDLNTTPINGTQDLIETSIDSAVSTDAITIVSGRLIGQLWPVGVGPGAVPCPAAPAQYQLPFSNQYDIIWSGADRPNTTDRRFLSIDGVELVEVTNVSPGFTVTFTSQPSRRYPLTDETESGDCDTGRPVYLIEDTTFCVDANQTLRRIRRNAVLPGCTPALGSDDQAIAENIEDLQFAYAIADATGQLNVGGNNMLDNTDFIDGTLVVDDTAIRAVRINILARTDKADINYQGLGNLPASIEDRAHVQAADNFKRRWWRSIVKMRNQ